MNCVIHRENSAYIAPEFPPTTPEISQERKAEIARILNQLSILTDDLCMVFALQPLLDYPHRRYTATNPMQRVELVVLTQTESTAERLLYDWVVYEAKEAFSSPFEHNLLILSEEEFVDVFHTMTSFRERVLAGKQIFDRDGESWEEK